MTKEGATRHDSAPGFGGEAASGECGERAMGVRFGIGELGAEAEPVGQGLVRPLPTAVDQPGC
jgi:hypothetical protein